MTQMTSIPTRKALGVPFLVGTDGSKHKLEQVELKQTGAYNEAWLQQLIHAHPEILPILQIEPGFGRPIPVAREPAPGRSRGRSGPRPPARRSAGPGSPARPGSRHW